MKQYIHFVLDPDEGSSQWSISFTEDDENIIVGLHWNEKSIATHEFKCTKADFTKMAATLLGVTIP